MIVTTTNNIDGQQVAQYLRVVSGEVIVGANFFKDIAAGFRNIVGGRSQAYEGELRTAREGALAGSNWITKALAWTAACSWLPRPAPP